MYFRRLINQLIELLFLLVCLFFASITITLLPFLLVCTAIANQVNPWDKLRKSRFSRFFKYYRTNETKKNLIRDRSCTIKINNTLYFLTANVNLKIDEKGIYLEYHIKPEVITNISSLLDNFWESIKRRTSSQNSKISRLRVILMKKLIYIFVVISKFACQQSTYLLEWLKSSSPVFISWQDINICRVKRNSKNQKYYQFDCILPKNTSVILFEQIIKEAETKANIKIENFVSLINHNSNLSLFQLHYGSAFLYILCCGKR